MIRNIMLLSVVNKLSKGFKDGNIFLKNCNVNISFVIFLVLLL